MDSRLETIPPGGTHLDTVRALHQTVVSLRTALEISKNELRELKDKYEQHSHCLEYADVIEKLTVENHILRRKIIDSGYEETDKNPQDIKLEVTYNPDSENVEYNNCREGTSTLLEEQKFGEGIQFDLESVEINKFCSSEKLNEIPELYESLESPALNITEINPEGEHNTDIDVSQITSLPKQENDSINQTSYKTKLELLSKFDVHIKVRTLKEGNIVSSSTSESEYLYEDKKSKSETKPNFEFKEKIEQFEKAQDPKGNKINIKSVSTGNIKMAVPNEGDVKNKTDKFDVQVRITSEENLVIKDNVEKSVKKDTLNLDVDDLSLR